MTELVEKLTVAMAAFEKDAKAAATGNKAAGARARKVSLEIEKDLKAFRKVSIAAANYIHTKIAK